MIFVTVGTHEQPFNRLVECIDKLKKDGDIREEVIIQTGYSTYEPQHCKWQKLFPYQEMLKLVEEAQIVITHGGPSSFIMPLQIGKIPIVVPRRHEFNEHVNDHQRQIINVFNEKKYLIGIQNVEDLPEALKQIKDFKPKEYKGDNRKIIKLIEDFIDNIK